MKVSKHDASRYVHEGDVSPSEAGEQGESATNIEQTGDYQQFHTPSSPAMPIIQPMSFAMSLGPSYQPQALHAMPESMSPAMDVIHSVSSPSASSLNTFMAQNQQVIKSEMILGDLPESDGENGEEEDEGDDDGMYNNPTQDNIDSIYAKPTNDITTKGDAPIIGKVTRIDGD